MHNFSKAKTQSIDKFAPGKNEKFCLKIIYEWELAVGYQIFNCILMNNKLIWNFSIEKNIWNDSSIFPDVQNRYKLLEKAS